MGASHPLATMRIPTPLLGAALLGALAGPLLAQAEPWVRQAPIPTSGSIDAVALLSPDEVWCTAASLMDGQAGLAHSTNAGGSWGLTDLGTTAVNSLFFVDAQHGWAAGNGIVYTTDGGQTWTKANDWGSIYDLHFVDTQRGWACGNGAATYRTTDGGLTWNWATAPAGTTLSSIWFVDALNGWTVSIGGKILRSADGGATWTLAHDSGEYLSTIQFLTPQEGWAIGGDTFLHTTDGGVTWTAATVPGGTWSHGARFFDAQRGVAVGQGVWRTSDGGQTWTAVQAPAAGLGLWDVEYADAQTVVASGVHGLLLRSTDGGATWSSIQSGAWGIARGLDFVDAGSAWAANQGGEIVRTTNGGQRWERAIVAGGATDMNDVDFVDAQTGWAAGENVVARSTDGGASWTQQVASGLFLGVTAFDAQTAAAFGATMLRTADGGASWQPTGPAKGYFRGGCTVDATTGWVVGSAIWRTTDAGATWTEQLDPKPELAAVSFADGQHGWASGYSGTLLHTTDGGVTWKEQDAGAPAGAALTGVWAVSPTTAWVVGWYGFAARTTDAGLTWQAESLPGGKNAYLESVAFFDGESGWASGDKGIWRRNFGEDLGTNYCGPAAKNSTGESAVISAFGSPVAAANHLQLTASLLPLDQFGYFLVGEDLGFVPFAGGSQGHLCLSGTIGRFLEQLGNTGADGELSIAVDLTALPTFPPVAAQAGETWYFQAWYRDLNPGKTSNFTDGIWIAFE